MSTSSFPLTNDELDWILLLKDSELETWLMELSPNQRNEVLERMDQRLEDRIQQQSPELVKPDLSTPAQFALQASRGRWWMPPHLQYLNRLLTAGATGTPASEPANGNGVTSTNCKRLIVTMPPRHGKSEFCSHWFPAWFEGTFPDKRVILTSYEAKFAESWGGRARSSLERNAEWFGIRVSQESHAKSHWEIADRAGGMWTAGVGGPITGKGADLLIVDDPIKNAEEAASETRREAIWNWWTSTAYTRLEPDAMVCVIQTRWHEDDLAGRLIRQSAEDPSADQWHVVNLPALAEEGDILGRRIGQPLWPERFGLQVLQRIQSSVGPRVWESLYQQRPAPREGGMFKYEWFEIVDHAPTGLDTVVRGWDFAATDGDGDYTAGVAEGKRGDDLWILDVVRGQWASGNRDDNVSLIAMEDETKYGERVQIWFPQDPGQAGKQQAEIIAKMLAGYRVRYETMSGDKETRADPFAAFCWASARAGRKVKLVRGSWNRPFLDELCGFPTAKHDDQVDAAALAFNKLAKPKKPFAVGVS